MLIHAAEHSPLSAKSSSSPAESICTQIENDPPPPPASLLTPAGSSTVLKAVEFKLAFTLAFMQMTTFYPSEQHAALATK